MDLRKILSIVVLTGLFCANGYCADRPQDDVFTKGLWYFESLANQQAIDENGLRANNLTKVIGNDVSLVLGVIGNAIEFDGTNRIDAAAQWPIYNSGGAEFWFKAYSTGGTRVMATANSRWVVQLADAHLQFIVWDNANAAKTLTFSNAVTIDQWQYVKATVNSAGSMSFELDGNVVTGALTTPPIRQIATSPLSVGAHPTASGGRHFVGAIDELKVVTPSSPQSWSNAWQSPLEDQWAVKGLWHFESIENVGSDYVTLDDNSRNPERANNLALYQANVKAASGQGPQLVSGDNPLGNAAFGNSMSFDSLYGHDLRVPLDLGTNNIRFEAWIKGSGSYPATSYTNYSIFGQSNRLYLDLRYNSAGTTIFVARTYTATGAAVDHATVSLESLVIDKNGWVHVAVSFNDGVLWIEINGQIVKSSVIATQTLNTPATIYPLTIGSRTSVPFWGKIDEVRIGEAVPTVAGCGFWGYSAADLNRDCYVDIADLSILVGQWLSCTTPGDSDCIPW